MEIRPLLDIGRIEKRYTSLSGRTIMSVDLSGTSFLLVITGVGVMNTAQALTSILEHTRPAIVIQTGIAGIFHETGLAIGTVAVAQTDTYIHTGVENKDSTSPLLPLPFDLINENSKSRRGHYSMDEKMGQKAWQIIKSAFHSPPGTMEKLERPPQADPTYSSTGFTERPNTPRTPKNDIITPLSRGNFITVSSITATKKTAAMLFSAFNPVMESMEGAAAAHVASLYKIPFLELRAASNYVGIRDKAQWNIPLAIDKTGIALESLLQKGEKTWTQR